MHLDVMQCLQRTHMHKCASYVTTQVLGLVDSPEPQLLVTHSERKLAVGQESRPEVVQGDFPQVELHYILLQFGWEDG
jgi:hypothetical protein